MLGIAHLAAATRSDSGDFLAPHCKLLQDSEHLIASSQRLLFYSRKFVQRQQLDNEEPRARLLSASQVRVNKRRKKVRAKSGKATQSKPELTPFNGLAQVFRAVLIRQCFRLIRLLSQMMAYAPSAAMQAEDEDTQALMSQIRQDYVIAQDLYKLALAGAPIAWLRPRIAGLIGRARMLRSRLRACPRRVPTTPRPSTSGVLWPKCR